MADDMKDLDKFLSNIDDVQSIIQGLSTEDTEKRTEWETKADKIITKTAENALPTGVNRSVINKKAFQDDPAPQPEPENMSQDYFMASLERDANERHERKLKSQKEANQIKDRGNELFKTGDYEGAVSVYTEALSKAKDISALWTNRAQAYIKLEKYKEAIEDCDWALRVFENCLKAHIHQGRAYLGLKQYDEALVCYEKARRIDPKKAAVIDEYMAEVERRRHAESDEIEAQKLFSEGDASVTSVVEVIQRLDRDSQIPLFYSGGLRLLSTLLDNTQNRTLFRTNGGMNFIVKHPVISRCLNSAPTVLTREEKDICATLFDMYTAACTENEENVRQLVEATEFPQYTMKFLEAKLKNAKVKEACVKLLNTMSQCELGRAKIAAKFDITRLIFAIFSILNLKGTIGVNAAGFLNNLALSKKFKSEIRESIDSSLLPQFEELMKMYSPKPDDSCGILYALLGLLNNLTADKSQHMLTFSSELCQISCVLLQSHQLSEQVFERTIGLLAHILPVSPQAVDAIVAKDDVIGVFVNALRAENANNIRGAIKAIAGCTQHSKQARLVLLAKKGLKYLLGLLKSSDEVVQGNAALCLGHLTSEEDVAGKLAETNIVQNMLVLARDGRHPSVRENSAILVAKLVSSDQRHYTRLHELNGLGILQNCMKYLKS